MNPELSQEQLQALQGFAARHGAGWKTILLYAWAGGTDTQHIDGHLLRQIRNQFGPKWLKGFVLHSISGASTRTSK